MLARAVRLPAGVDPADVTARYDKGVLEVSVPAEAVKPEGTRIPIENAAATPEQPTDRAAMPEQQPDQAGMNRPGPDTAV